MQFSQTANPNCIGWHPYAKLTLSWEYLLFIFSFWSCTSLISNSGFFSLWCRKLIFLRRYKVWGWWKLLSKICIQCYTLTFEVSSMRPAASISTQDFCLFRFNFSSISSVFLKVDYDHLISNLGFDAYCSSKLLGTMYLSISS